MTNANVRHDVDEADVVVVGCKQDKKTTGGCGPEKRMKMVGIGLFLSPRVAKCPDGVLGLVCRCWTPVLVVPHPHLAVLDGRPLAVSQSPLWGIVLLKQL